MESGSTTHDGRKRSEYHRRKNSPANTTAIAFSTSWSSPGSSGRAR